MWVSLDHAPPLKAPHTTHKHTPLSTSQRTSVPPDEKRLTYVNPRTHKGRTKHAKTVQRPSESRTNPRYIRNNRLNLQPSSRAPERMHQQRTSRTRKNLRRVSEGVFFNAQKTNSSPRYGYPSRKATPTNNSRISAEEKCTRNRLPHTDIHFRTTPNRHTHPPLSLLQTRLEDNNATNTRKTAPHTPSDTEKGRGAHKNDTLDHLGGSDGRSINQQALQNTGFNQATRR